jgi:ribosomal protein S18 acetylase RimI-like enzyme
MPNTNKTLNIRYRFLAEKDFKALYETNLAAFSDYFVPLQMTGKQFRNHIAQNNVNLNLSVGAFAGNKMVGFTLNGFGEWNDKATAYDAGTGVVPGFRRQKIGQTMFAFLLPKLKEIGTEQILLEVLSQNENAIKLYCKLGFKETRKLLFFEQTATFATKTSSAIEIRQLKKPDWNQLKSFGDGRPSWQFSSRSLERKLTSNLFFGAYLENKLVGYSGLFPTSGTIPQIAVDKEFRRKGIAFELLSHMQSKVEKNKNLRFSNVDENIKSLTNFIDKLNFKPTISQNEMVLELTGS